MNRSVIYTALLGANTACAINLIMDGGHAWQHVALIAVSGVMSTLSIIKRARS